MCKIIQRLLGEQSVCTAYRAGLRGCQRTFSRFCLSASDGFTKTLIVHLEGGSYLGKADRVCTPSGNLDYFCKNLGPCLGPEERNADLSGFRHREGSVCSEETSQWGAGVDLTLGVYFTGMVMR